MAEVPIPNPHPRWNWVSVQVAGVGWRMAEVRLPILGVIPAECRWLGWGSQWPRYPSHSR